MTREEATRQVGEHAERLRREFRVRTLRLFGSVARGEAAASSDIDFLVEFDGPPTFRRFMGLKFALEDLLGVRVDLVTPDGLRPWLRTEIEREAVLSRSPRLYREDIVTACSRIREYTAGIGLQSLTPT